MSEYLTEQGLEKLKKELKYLEKVKRKEVSERIRDTASQGDLKENAGYDAAKEEQGFVEARIKELRQIISKAKIIEVKEKNKVQVGSFVSLEINKDKKTFQIVGPEESDILKNKISFKSPLGSALLDKKRGDLVEIETSEGKQEYKIINLD